MLFDSSSPIFASSIPENNNSSPILPHSPAHSQAHSQPRSSHTRPHNRHSPVIRHHMDTGMTTSLRIAVTGSAGLVGVAVIRQALEDGHSVIGLDIVPPSHPNTQLAGIFSSPDGSTSQDRDEAVLERMYGGLYKYHQVSALDYEEYRDACRGCQGIIHLAMIPNGPDVDVRDPPLTTGGRSQREVHNANVAMSFNTFQIAAELDINRLALASSINAVGMLFSKRPTYDYLPLDEKHACRPEDAYSLSKYFSELQGESFVRRHPDIRIANLRFHGVVPSSQVNAEHLHSLGGSWRDLWGWVSTDAVAKSCLLSLTAPTSTFPQGTSETFFIVAPTICDQTSTFDLLLKHYPEIIKEGRMSVDVRGKGNVGLFDCSKAKRMLGWSEKGVSWMPPT